MSGNNDKSFMITFAGVLGAIGVFTVAILVIAGFASEGHQSTDPRANERLAARIAPVGTVVTDPSMLVKVSAAAPHAPLSGAQVVGNVCSACHGTGMLGAPKIGDKAAWSERFKADGGLDGLAASAMKGKNQMPPRGGNPDLSDAEIKAAIQEMLKQTGV